MVKWFVFLGICLHSLAAALQFPTISFYRLDETQEAVPHHCVEILFLGFRPEAKGEMSKWYEAFRHEQRLLPFTVMPVFPSLMATPLIRKPLLSLLDSYVPWAVRDHIGINFDGEAHVAATLQIAPSDVHSLHVFVVDTKGAIVWQGRGAPTHQTITAMKRAVQALIPENS